MDRPRLEPTEEDRSAACTRPAFDNKDFRGRHGIQVSDAGFLHTLLEDNPAFTVGKPDDFFTTAEVTCNAVKWYREQDGKKGLENTYCNLLVDPLAMIFLRASPKTEYGIVIALPTAYGLYETDAGLQG